MPLTQKRRLVTFTSPLGPDAFLCTGFRGRERLSAPFEFTLDLISENTAVAPADLVGKAVGWSVTEGDAPPRHFHGYVRALAAGPVTDRARRAYRAEVVPWLWFLTRTTDCRIFQNQTIDAIVTGTFDRLGLADYKKQLAGTYPTRDYCVQYRETAFAFVSRLMEEYGIYYTFAFGEGKHTLVLADAPSAYAACAQKAAEYRPDRPGDAAVTSWERRYAFGSGKLTHTDYNFETPSTALLKSTDTVVELPGIAKFELFDFPGGYPVAGDGQTLAKARLEAVEAGYDTAAGASGCASFTAGGTFDLERHPADKGAFVLLEVEHRADEGYVAGGGGAAAEYANTFVAAPAATPFRPPRTTPKPVVPGAQTAVVVGPAGEEIYTDQYGRVKVQFHWDRLGKRDENSSCWLRVSELWAGKQWGMVFTPRIGQEVVVEFLEGDPDRPLVTGRVYNAEQMPPYALPANMTQSGLKTRSTKGGGEADFNELRFEDAKGKEDIYFHAQKDFHRFVENDDDLKVEHDQTIQIKNNRTLTVQEGYEKITIEKGDRERTVSKGNDTLLVSEGNRAVTVSKGDASLTVSTGNRLVTVSKGDYALDVSKGALLVTVATGKFETTVKADCTTTVQEGNRSVGVSKGNDALTVSQGNIDITAAAGAITLEAAKSITLKVGANQIVIDTSGIVIQATAKFEVGPSGIAGKGVTIAWKGDAQFKAEAAAVEVTGAATTEIKGGLVKIN